MTQTATKTKPTREPRNRYDLIGAILKDEFNSHARAVDHYGAMEGIAESERGKAKWAHLRRLSQKLKDDICAALHAWEDNKTIEAIALSLKEARNERRSLIRWVESHKDDPRHIERAAEEIGYFAGLFKTILITARDRVTLKSIQREAATYLATLK